MLKVGINLQLKLLLIIHEAIIFRHGKHYYILVFAEQVVTIATLYSGYVYINDWFCSTAASNNIDPKGKGPEIHIESPEGSIRGASNNKSILGTIGDTLIFNRVRNISDAATYLTQKYLPYMDHGE